MMLTNLPTNALIVIKLAKGDVAGKALALAVAIDDGEYQEKVQMLDYDVRISIKVSHNNQDVSTVDISDIPNSSGDDDQQVLSIYQEESESDIPNASSDDDSQTWPIYQKESERLIPNQSLDKDAPIIELIRTLPQHHTRGIPKHTYMNLTFQVKSNIT
ncbi:hypothetical protein U1Q18_014144 [Sarracenia purpurea var. burkii]